MKFEIGQSSAWSCSSVSGGEQWFHGLVDIRDADALICHRDVHLPSGIDCVMLMSPSDAVRQATDDAVGHRLRHCCLDITAGTVVTARAAAAPRA